MTSKNHSSRRTLFGCAQRFMSAIHPDLLTEALELHSALSELTACRGNSLERSKATRKVPVDRYLEALQRAHHFAHPASGQAHRFPPRGVTRASFALGISRQRRALATQPSLPRISAPIARSLAVIPSRAFARLRAPSRSSPRALATQPSLPRISALIVRYLVNTLASRSSRQCAPCRVARAPARSHVPFLTGFLWKQARTS